MERARLAARVAGPDDVTGRVRVLVRELAQRVPEFVRGDERPLRAAAGRGRLRAADAAVRERVGERERLDVLPGDAERRQVGGQEEVVLLRARAAGGVQSRTPRPGRQRRAIGDAARQRVGRAGVGEVESQRRVAAHVAVVGVAADAGVLRDDLQPVDVEVVAVAAERLDAPLHVQVPVDVGAELGQLVGLVAVAQDHQVEPLARRAGDLDRHHRGAPGLLGARGRGAERGRECGDAQNQQSESHCLPLCRVSRL